MTLLLSRSTRSRDPLVPQSRAKLRVCFVMDRLSRAGTESQLLALIQHLDRTRFEPTLILLDGESQESRELEPKNCTVVRLGVKKLFSGDAIRAWQCLRVIWTTQPPDIVQAYFLDSAYFAIPLAKLCGVRTILRVRNNLGYWLTDRHRLLNRIVGRWVTATLTNSESGRQQLIEREGHSSDRVVVIENGVDLDRYSKEVSPRQGTIRIGCVANLRPIKNIDGLMRVAKHLLERYPQLCFEIAGDGEERARLEQLHRESPLGSRWKFVGSLPNVPEFLATLHIAVLPSHSEGMSNALLEYMAAGLPIVATDVGANRDVLNGSGLLVPPGNDKAMAEAIALLIENPDLAKNLGDSVRTRVAREFSRIAMRDRFQNFYFERSTASQGE